MLCHAAVYIFDASKSHVLEHIWLYFRTVREDSSGFIGQSFVSLDKVKSDPDSRRLG